MQTQNDPMPLALGRVGIAPIVLVNIRITLFSAYIINLMFLQLRKANISLK